MKVFTDNFSNLPENFRKDLFVELSSALKKELSVQLVSTSGMGGSIIARAVTQVPQIKQKYFDKKTTLRLLDSDMLLERTPVALSRLFLSTIEAVYEVSNDMIVIQNKIEESISKICGSGKLIVVFDHFDKLNQPELSVFFSNLARLHRIYGPNLLFIFIINHSFENTENAKNFEQFSRIVNQKIIKVNPLDKRDSVWFIGEVAKNLNLKLTENQIHSIYEVSGGFPRLMKRLVETVRQGEKLEEIVNDPTLSNVLKTCLDELAQNSDLADRIPLLQKYLEKIRIGSGEDVVGEFVFPSRLTKLEEKLLLFFQKNKIIRREDGINMLWGENALEISEHAYDQLVLRLRKKLKSSKPRAEIETIRGRGHVLTSNNEG